MKALKLSIFYLVFILFFDTGAYGYQINGSVVDVRNNPVSYAIVRAQATDIKTMTDSKGNFTLKLTPAKEITLTAWKEGYINGGLKLISGQKDVIIKLKSVPLYDNKDYQWIHPDPPTLFQKFYIVFWNIIAFITRDEKFNSRFKDNCSNCHSSFIFAQWREDAHSNSARNPVLLTMYNGTDMNGKSGVYPGFKIDFPNSKGNCSTCHAPAQSIANPWGTDLNNVIGIGKEGIFCDFCHKIKDVGLHPDGGYPGVLSIKFNRPPRGEQIFYGPYDDVIAGPDTFSSLYKKSLFCAPCHSAKFWDVPIYSEFDEWLNSPYSKEGKECQDCHMPPDGKTTHFAPPEKGGVKRDPKTIATHNNPGSRNIQFLSDAIKMELQVERRNSIIDATVRLTNEKAGHHFPTGVPMRNMILLVEAKDNRGMDLKYIRGTVVPEWGGAGLIEKGNYAGLPGKGFAKVLANASRKYPEFNTNVKFPIPHWRQAVILSDNRIPARGTDISHYRFELNGTEKDCINVKSRVIYRRAFKPWIDDKGWQLKDLEIAKKDFKLCN